MVARVDKLDGALSGAHGSVGQHRDSLSWLRRVAQSQEPEFYQGPDLEQILLDFHNLGAVRSRPEPVPPDVPADQLVQLFPGADHPGLPTDVLVQISGIWSPEPPPDIVYP